MGSIRWIFPSKPWSRWIKIALWLYVGQALAGAVFGLILGTCIALKGDTCFGFELSGVVSWLSF